MTSDQYNLTGPTGDPNNVDTDGDGIIDGLSCCSLHGTFLLKRGH